MNKKGIAIGVKEVGYIALIVAALLIILAIVYQGIIGRLLGS